jgi:hypothetical protein
MERLTLFTVPKSFEGIWETIQLNSLKSWFSLIPTPIVYLLGDKKDLGNRKYKYLSVKKSTLGTPLLPSVLEALQSTKTTDTVVLINADIILNQDFPDTIDRIKEHPGFSSKPNYFMVGNRWDLKDGILTKHPASGLDFFVWNKTFLKFEEAPNLVYGRTSWDNWLPWYARSRGCLLVDITKGVTIVHQSHDYSHSKENVWTGSEAQQNQLLTVNKRLTIKDADLIYTKERLRNNPLKFYYKLRRRL